MHIHDTGTGPSPRRWLIGGSLTVLQVGIVCATTFTLMAAFDSDMPALSMPTAGLMFLTSFLAGCVFAIPPVAVGTLAAVALWRLWRITFMMIYAFGGAVIGVGWVIALLAGIRAPWAFTLYTAGAWSAVVGFLAGSFLWLHLKRHSETTQRSLLRWLVSTF